MFYLKVEGLGALLPPVMCQVVLGSCCKSSRLCRDVILIAGCGCQQKSLRLGIDQLANADLLTVSCLPTRR